MVRRHKGVDVSKLSMPKDGEVFSSDDAAEDINIVLT